MSFTKKQINRNRSGAALIVSMIFVLIFSALAVSMASLSGTNVQLSDNQHKVNLTFSAALSALECGKYIISNTPTVSTTENTVTTSQADATWNRLCANVQAQDWVNNQATVTADEIVTPTVNFGQPNTSFQIKFYRSDTHTIALEGVGYAADAGTVTNLDNGAQYSGISRRAGINLNIKKQSEVLEYAVASKSRIIITGDSTVEGNMYSTWDKPDTETPYSVSSASKINGSLNTVTDKSKFDPGDDDYVGYTLETLDENGDPMFDEEGNRIYSPGDMVQGQHEGINYDEPIMPMSGFSASDYDTSSYKDQTTEISESDTTVQEYFPHEPGDYSTRSGWDSKRLDRHVYENETFTNVRLPKDTNALFKNCTFEGVTFVECDENTGWRSKGNNVRFDDCAFNGTIVSDVPDDLEWKDNVLYFTGSATFNNEYMEEATILAPNFNVNIGNTQVLEEGSESVLTGLIVGGIVDVRGNANIDGTILSMFDPSDLLASGSYGTNIGFSDENNEAGIPEDIGTIHIHPNPGRLLPSGITTPIVIEAVKGTYSEMACL